MGFSRKGYRESKRKSLKKHERYSEYFQHLEYYQEVAYKLYTLNKERISTIDMLNTEEYQHILKDEIKVLIVDSLLDELYENNSTEHK